MMTESTSNSMQPFAVSAAPEDQRWRTQQNERIFHAWADTSYDIVIAFTPDGACSEVNARYFEVTGLTPQAAAGDGWLTVIHPEDSPRVQAELQEALARGADHETRYRLRTHDGYRRYVSRLHPMRDENGTILGWIGSAADVHDLWAAEQAIELLHDQHSAALGVLAHDLLNALVPIQNAAELLRLVDLNPAQGRRAAEMVATQVQHLRRRLDEVLDVSRISRGKVTVRKERILLEDLVNAAATMSRPAIEQRRHELKTTLPAEPAWLNVDARRMGQVLSGLLVQAAHFTPDGGCIHLSATVSNSEITIKVKDHGVGVDPTFLSRLFDLATRPDPSNDRVLPTSLGLAEMRKLIELHGGRLQARSSGADAGVTFLLTLPRAPAEPAETMRPAVPTASLSRQRILVVGEQRLFAEEWGMMLQLAGHDVQTRSIASALDAVRSFAPTVISLDLGGCDTNACAFVVTLQGQPDLPRPVVVATADSADPECQRRALDAGCDAVLVKPVRSKDFFAAIAACKPAPAATR